VVVAARSRGYGFIEFKDPEVAQIVAETMDKYFLDGKQLVCELMDPEKIHDR
jgi:nucleolar protein 15